METLVLTLLLIGVLFAFLSRGNEEAVPAGAPAEAEFQPSDLMFVQTVTVTADTPEELGHRINQARNQYANRFFGPRYTLGAPQITADGRTAYISLFL